jgi:hypothetical protein
MARKNTLIHLHGSTKLEDASKLNLCEIAVTHADTELNTELVVKTKVKGVDKLVYIPSLDKVNDVVADEAALREAEDLKLSNRIAAFEGTGTTSVTGKIEALKEELQGQIDAKVDTETYNKKMDELDAAISANGTALTSAVEALEAADDELEAAISAEGTARTEAVKTLNAAISAETTARTAAVEALNAAIALKADGTALTAAVEALEAADDALEAAMIKDATVTNGVKKSVENNILSLDFSSMTIDCGRYAEE